MERGLLRCRVVGVFTHVCTCEEGVSAGVLSGESSCPWEPCGMQGSGPAAAYERQMLCVSRSPAPGSVTALHLPAVQPQARRSTSLCLRFLCWKMELHQACGKDFA